MATDACALPASCSLPDERLQQLTGLTYEETDHGEYTSFRMAGSEHYSFIEEGPHRHESFVVQQKQEPGEQFVVVISWSCDSGEAFYSVKTRLWEGLEAFEAEQAAAEKASQEEAKAVAAEKAAERARAVSLAPTCVELFPKCAKSGYRQDVFVRLFAPEPRVVLSLAVSEPEANMQTLSFTSLGGDAVHALQAAPDGELPGDLWAALAAATGAPAYGISVALPAGGVAKGPPGRPLRLEQLMAGDVGEGWLAALLTARANFCMAHESSDEPVDSIAWTQSADEGAGFSAALEQQFKLPSGAEEACVAALKDAPIVIEAVYRSETVRSNRCWWVDSEFLVVVFGGHHEGTVLVQHVVNKDMS
jgi:hypothetical protein